jgi:predicted nucleotidyltransferase
MHGTLEEILARLRAGLEALYGPRSVHLLLYSSQARGETTAESDIDILVVLQGSVDPGAEIARAGELTASLSLQHNVVIACAFVAEERFRSERSRSSSTSTEKASRYDAGGTGAEIVRITESMACP